MSNSKLIVAYFARASLLRSPPPLFFYGNHFSLTYATTSNAASVVAYDTSFCNQVLIKDKKENKWFTLPPFTSTINPISVAKKLSNTNTTTSSTNNTTALKWILRCCPQLPRSLVQKLFRLRQVRKESICESNSQDFGSKPQEQRLKRVSAKDELSIGDKIFLPISVQEKQEHERFEKQEYQCSKDEISYIQSLELHKDHAIIVINKPHGMPVQGGIGIRNSLDVLAATALKYDYSEPPRLVHRLDRDSSGILVLGRTQTSAAVLHSIFREKTSGASTDDFDNTKQILQRSYWALVIGTPRRTSGLVSVPLGKVVVDNGKSERITTVDDAQTMSCQHAVTEYRVIESSHHGFTWLELRPLTGRKHQLRVHCAEVLRTPIVGDYKYGWQAHRKWKPVPWSNPEKTEKLLGLNIHPFGLDLESGSISEKQPHLHLHCKQMVLPDVSLALQYMQSSKDHDLSQLQSLKLAAPLPLHMQRSWDILKS
ncbi:Rna pseudouridine synthase 4 protein [Thalictrum thalictroides]|uniref:Rna pseudouridine synthase 4 protein n=1 Tax=Thalictrum thalictroides TaxID=46969 RepID=A0A7J6XCL9_THATH|nr:Rna pseudouridine synthase 4 protein [Thalictrum thalictroides]